MKRKFIVILVAFIVNFLFVDNAIASTCNFNRQLKIDDNKAIAINVDVDDVGGNNTTSDNIEKLTGEDAGGGVFLDARMKKKLSKEQAKLNENDENTLTFNASAISGHYIDAIYIRISVNEKIYLDYDRGMIFCEAMGDNTGNIKFNLKVKAEGFSKSDSIIVTLKGETGLNGSCAALNELNNMFDWTGIDTRGECARNKDFAVDILYEAFERATGATKEEQANIMNENVAVNVTTSMKSDVYYVPEATTLPTGGTGQSQKLECETSLKDFIEKIWKYVMILAPILLIVMITMDFFKALFSSDQELIQKAVNNSIKRTLAAIILLALPLLLSTILGFFGLELCI